MFSGYFIIIIYNIYIALYLWSNSRCIVCIFGSNFPANGGNFFDDVHIVICAWFTDSTDKQDLFSSRLASEFLEKLYS